MNNEKTIHHILCDVSDCGKVAKYNLQDQSVSRVFKIDWKGDYKELEDLTVYGEVMNNEHLCEEHAKGAGII